MWITLSIFWDALVLAFFSQKNNIYGVVSRFTYTYITISTYSASYSFPNKGTFMEWNGVTLREHKGYQKSYYAFELLAPNSIDWINKWVTITQTPSSNGSKNRDIQSWRSKKAETVWVQLHFSRLYIVNRCSPSDPGSIPDRHKIFAVLWSTDRKISFFTDLIYIY